VAYTFHRRAEWLRFSKNPMSGPSQDRSQVVELVIHYNGGNADLDGPDNIFQDDDYAKVLAAMNDSYWATRGYALGYNFGLGPDGDLWEIRGVDLRCAANGCQAVNVPGVAIQVTTTAITAPPTAAQVDALKNDWVPWVRRQYPNVLDVVGHRDVNPRCANPTGTVCPGPQLYPLVQSGYFDSPEDELTDDDKAWIQAEIGKAVEAIFTRQMQTLDLSKKQSHETFIRETHARTTNAASGVTDVAKKLDEVIAKPPVVIQVTAEELAAAIKLAICPQATA
jgi:hypothetical protein